MNKLHVWGLTGTILVHALVIATAVLGDQCSSPAEATTEFGEAETIEAALAFKQVNSSKQPQKLRRTPVAEEAIKLAKEPDAKPEEAPKDPKKVEKPINFEDVLNTHRQEDDPDLPTHGVDEIGHEGSADGSEWGTEKEAKGDPYVGELKGRIYDAWNLPALEQGSGVVLGCVKLNEEGKIIATEVRERSDNANLNRSVELALSDPKSGMEKPVPEDPAIRELLIEKGICFRMKPGAE